MTSIELGPTLAAHLLPHESDDGRGFDRLVDDIRESADALLRIPMRSRERMAVALMLNRLATAFLQDQITHDRLWFGEDRMSGKVSVVHSLSDRPKGYHDQEPLHCS